MEKCTQMKFSDGKFHAAALILQEMAAALTYSIAWKTSLSTFSSVCLLLGPLCVPLFNENLMLNGSSFSWPSLVEQFVFLFTQWTLHCVCWGYKCSVIVNKQPFQRQYMLRELSFPWMNIQVSVMLPSHFPSRLSTSFKSHLFHNMYRKLLQITVGYGRIVIAATNLNINCPSS